MDRPRCPGQDMRRWKPADVFQVPCPHCGAELEIFKDEPFRTCRACRRKVRNPHLDTGCAEWCKYADKCFGVTSVPQSDSSLCDALIGKMKDVFGDDEFRIRHALAVLDYAERLMDAEGGDPLVIRAAAVLHDIGIQEAERKHGSSAGRFQELEGPPIARRTLEGLGVDEDSIEHVCRIVGSHHSAGDIDTIEFRIIWDADQLVNIPGTHKDADREKLERVVGRLFRTGAGKALAATDLLSKKDRAGNGNVTP